MSETGTVICGQMEEVMPRIPSESVDVMFTSPPYGVGKDYEPDIRIGVLFRLLNNAFRETERVLKRGGYAVFNFGNLIPARDILGTDEPCEMPMGWVYWSLGLANGLVLQAQRVWQKDFSKVTSGKHAISAPRAVPEFEHLFTFRKIGGGAQVVRNRQASQRAIWSTVGDKAIRSAHPAAFPETLVERVLESYTDPGDVILDPFAGSGTVGVVCQRMGRRYILIEKEPGYCDIIKENLASEGAQFDDTIPMPDNPDIMDLFNE